MISGTVSTVLFACAHLPMVFKAIRSRDMRSYSAASLAVGNVANLVHTVYVLSLPVGPVWFLHGFYLVTMGLMLVMWMRFGRSSADRPTAVPFGHDGHERRSHRRPSGVRASRVAARARRVRRRPRR